MHHMKREVHFFMLQIEIVSGNTKEELQNSVNTFLKTVSEDAVNDIKVEAEKGTATILYTVKETWQGHLCCDCRHWDDSNDAEALIGLCQECGGRRRFNNKSCNHFKDVRG